MDVRLLAVRLRSSLPRAASRCAGMALASVLALLTGPAPAHAFPGKLEAWQQRYGAISPSADRARCQLCHADTSGGSPWNAYGWAMRDALADLTCDLDGNGSVSDPEALFCIELADSDGDGSSTDNITEIGLGTQPGWALGNSNTLYTRGGTTLGQPAPTGIGKLDPDGTEPPPPPTPEPP